jgi:hypothetical protein
MRHASDEVTPADGSEQDWPSYLHTDDSIAQQTKKDGKRRASFQLTGPDPKHHSQSTGCREPIIRPARQRDSPDVDVLLPKTIPKAPTRSRRGC